MSNAITTFNNDVLNASIRTMTDENDEPWFVGKDIAEALGYKNLADALSKHVDDEDKGVAKCDTLGGRQDVTIINESGMYSLIFGSKLESAKKFKRWVTCEVLPSIRKTGKYSMKKDEELDDGAFAVEVAHFILGNPHISVADKIGMCQSMFGDGKIPSVADIKAKRTQEKAKPTPPKAKPTAKQGDLFAASSAPLRLLLNGRGISSHRFNQILEKKGYIEQLYCNSNSHSYYVLTDKGKEYGYNIGSASYSIIHWRVERFEELFRIVTNSAAK